MGKLYNKMLDINVLNKAFDNCKKGVAWKKSVQKFESHKFSNLLKILNDLKNKTYIQGKPYMFTLRKRGKVREIKAVHIYDRIVQKVLCDEILMPEVRKYIIYDNGSSVKKRGITFSRKRLKVHLMQYYKWYGTNVGYVLIIDCKKYFDSMNHEVFINMLEEIIWDNDVMWLVKEILSKNGNGIKGVDIGNQISQVAGIFYLYRIDNFCKIVKGEKFYARYQDDIYIIHENKEYLKSLQNELIEQFAKIKLEMNMKKTQISRIDKGFVYLKTKFTLQDNGNVLMKTCKRNIEKEKRKLRKMYNNKVEYFNVYESYKSWRGSVLKYNNYKVILETDKLFWDLYGYVEFN